MLMYADHTSHLSCFQCLQICLCRSDAGALHSWTPNISSPPAIQGACHVRGTQGKVSAATPSEAQHQRCELCYHVRCQT